jgi:type III secretion protein U
VSDNRTEKPTAKRLRDSRRKGEVARSKELAGAAALLAGLGAVIATGGRANGMLTGWLRSSLSRALAGDVNPAAAIADGLAMVARIALPICGVALLGGALGALAQVGFNWSSEAVSPKLERLDPLAGMKKLLAPRNFVQAAVGILKTLAAGWVAWRGVAAAAGSLAQAPRLTATGAGALVTSTVLPLALQLAGVLLAFGVLDFLLARRRHGKSLSMTKDEVRREHKESEGDPRHKAERKRLHRALGNVAPIARARVVVVNPTHLAIALQHQPGTDEAPRIIAKGAGDEAARIRAEARRCGVPIVRDVPLARALFRLAEVGDEIPEELFQAAALILAHLYADVPNQETA